MATDLDVPVLMSADHIRRREFVAVRRGYDPTQVREFLDKVAAQIEQMASLLRDARMEAATVRTAAPRTDPYDELAGRVAGVLRAAAEEAEEIRREARSERERILGQATEEAERVRAEAEGVRADAEAHAREVRERAEAALREAQERADRTLVGLSTKRDELVEQLASMQARLVGVARELESTISTPEIGSPTERTATASEPDRAGDAGPPDAPSEPGADTLEERSERMIVLGEAEDEDGTGDDPEVGLADPSVLGASLEDAWGGTEAIPLDVPDMPPLDLDWGDAPGDDERPG